MATLLEGQKYLGGWAEPVADSNGKYPNIICFDINGSPKLAFFVPWYVVYNAGSGKMPPYCCKNCGFANVPVDYDFSTKKFIYVRINTYDLGSEGDTIDAYTITNTVANNAKHKDAAFNGFEYVPINTDYRVDKKSNTLIPGIGVVYGDYFLTGGVSLKDNTLFVSGHGTRHTPTYDGVTFWMTATVLIDGKVFAKEALKRSGGHELVPEHGIPIGSTTFSLPEPVSGQKTQLLLEGSFNIDNLEGNASMPSATFTQDIDIQPKLKNGN